MKGKFRGKLWRVFMEDYNHMIDILKNIKGDRNAALDIIIRDVLVSLGQIQCDELEPAFVLPEPSGKGT